MNVQGYSGMGLSPFVGTGIGSASASGTFGLGVSTRASVDSGSGESTSATFAQDIIRRIGTSASQASQASQATQATQATQETDASSGFTSQAATGNAQKSTDELESSLVAAVESVRADHGDEAATAVMGLIYQGVGNGPVTEENLGQGLLSALKLVDREFGIAAGDKLIAQFNTGVNQAMNEYFDNGLNEMFYASTSTGQNPAIQALQKVQSDVLAGLDDEAAVSVLDILRQSIEEFGATPEGLRQGVDAANQWLAENRPDANGLALSTLVDLPSGASTAKGTLFSAVA